MKLNLLMNIVIGCLFLTIGFVNIIINSDLMANSIEWSIAVYSIIGIGGFNIGIAIAKINKLSK